MFKKISKIKDMGVFRDFDWNRSVRDHGKNIVELKQVNIFYGRNYTGKTTLSRIFRTIEKGELPPKYENPQFSVHDVDNDTITQDSLSQCDKTIRVFNKDFVKDNLRFVIDDEHDINSFAVLGEENTRIGEEIKSLESELGSETDKTGLFGELIFAKNKHVGDKATATTAETSLENKLRNKAREIKNQNTNFGDVNYDITKIKRDINTVRSASYSPINSNKESELQDLLKEETKDEISALADFDLKFDSLAEEAKTLVECKINISESIQELVDNALLHKWVREGRELHQDKLDVCAFCGNSLTPDLWDKLDKHFNQESEQLREDIEQLINKINSEKIRTPALLVLKPDEFYSTFQARLNEIQNEYREKSELYLQALQSLITQLERRRENIFTKLAFQIPEAAASELSDIQNKYQDVVNRSNAESSVLGSKQTQAKISLRLNEVNRFISDIEYEKEQENISQLGDTKIQSNIIYEEKSKQVNRAREQIEALKNQLRDEALGAAEVNTLLSKFFGYDFLSLVAVESQGDEVPSECRFEVRRGSEKAYNLSEGECSLIAFCYFMAKLDDIETKDSKPIIWIDDPVSSLDSNHIFFIYSLINSQIVKPKKYEQLFISTHNLDFLKYLKRLSKDYKGEGANKQKIREFFLIEREHDVSSILTMPRYMEEYVTEFNYLFSQIYKCAQSSVNDENYQHFYNFGNNARKFLEIFLYYRYPNMDDFHQKLTRFFGEDHIPQIVTDRINNEYSHLSGSLERGSHPVEVPEMQTTAGLILNKIKNYDAEQYQALLKSIGEHQK